MSFQWPVDVAALWTERYPQMVNRGLPDADVDGIRERVTEMWGDEPGTWVFEWSRVADRYVAQGDPALAVLAYGYAKFPTLADSDRRAAYAKQIEQCQIAASTGPVNFERRVVAVEHRGEQVPVTVHQCSPPGADLAQAPVLLASGGVDMWKEDLQGMWETITLLTGITVLAFDIPGTGESTVAMSAESADIVSQLVGEAGRLGNGRVAHFGISMGGYFSARTALSGEVDAAVVFGGPVRQAFAPPRMPSGAIGGIVGNALGFDALPSFEEFTAQWAPMSLASLVDTKTTTPMLVVNGANDPLIPQEDTLLFKGRPGAAVHLITDSGHCAAEKLAEVVPMIIGWLDTAMAAKDPEPYVLREGPSRDRSA
jgi:esterase FrsA